MVHLSKDAVKLHYNNSMKPKKLISFSLPGKRGHKIECDKLNSKIYYYYKNKLIHTIDNNYLLD